MSEKLLETNEFLIIRTDTTNSPTETESSVTVGTEAATENPEVIIVSDAQESSNHVKPENRDKVNCEKEKYDVMISCIPV